MQLTEWRPSPPMAVDLPVRRVLETIFGATVSAGHRPDEFVVRPGGVVGSVSVGDEVVTVTPKIDIDRVLFMVAYANDPYGWRSDLSAVGSVEDLVDGMAALFAEACRPMVARGLLRDYRRVDVDAAVVRGKVRWDVQARRWMPVPIALSHDVHDDDIVENRVLREACQVLRRGALSAGSAGALAGVWSAVRDLTPLPGAVAALERMRWTRRNLHYRPALELAGVILRGEMADVVAGDVPVSGFTLVMHDVFERFVRVALRTAWGVGERELPDSWSGRGLVLDKGGLVSLEPDIGWRRDDDGWRFVGDAKYRRDASGAGQSADIYQALAYAVATGLPEVTLFYADGGLDRDHVVDSVGKTVRVRHLDLSLPPDVVLQKVARLGHVQRVEDVNGNLAGRVGIRGRASASHAH